jgi:hypothetical protein
VHVFVVTHHTSDSLGDHVSVDSVHGTQGLAEARVRELDAGHGYGEFDELFLAPVLTVHEKRVLAELEA